MQATLSEKLAKLKLQIKLDLKGSDLEKLADLGQGNGGSVEKVKHVPTGTVMAKKVRFTDDFHVFRLIDV
jgi:mitogen-activated protein kinase kinase